MIYSNQFAVGNKPIGIASLAAMLKREGHEFKLFDCTAYNIEAQGKQDSNVRGDKTLEFKIPSNLERFPKRAEVTFEGLVDDMIQSIDDFQPDIIGLSALTDDYPLGLGLMREVRRVFKDIPTIAGGVHATVDPAGVLSEDCFDMVCVGEGEYVVLDIAKRIEEKKDFANIPNLWVKHANGTIERNAVRPYEQNLDVFPYPDWSIYSQVAFYKPFEGFIYKYGDFEMSRGCPYKCSYCINVQLQEIYRHTHENYHREKSIPRVIDEIKSAIENYDIEFLKFWDETFLLMSQERMEEFCDLYTDQIGLPYVIETTSQSITDFSVKILQKTNCKSASLGMETGNSDIRKGLLYKPTDNDVYEKAFGLMGEHGIRKASFNMIGLPNERQEDIFRTIAMNRLVETDTQGVGIFYPYKGTPIRNMLVSQGLLDDNLEVENLKNYNFNTFTTASGSIVRFKDMDSKLLNKLQLIFASYVVWPVTLWPLIDYIKNNDDAFAGALFENIQRISYIKRFGDLPPGDSKKPLKGMEVGHVSFGTSDTEAVSDYMQNQDVDFSGIDFDEDDVLEFAHKLVELWQGDGQIQLMDMLKSIAEGHLLAEFEIPRTKDGLRAWLFETAGEENSRLRAIRKELRGMAQDNSKMYATEQA